MGINLFPNIEKYNHLRKDTGLILDNGYLGLLLKWGVAMFILFAIIISILVSKKYYSITNYYIAIIAIWFIV